jgi:hypothetical protein
MRSNAGDSRHRRTSSPYKQPQHVLDSAITNVDVERCRLSFLSRHSGDAACCLNLCLQKGGLYLVEEDVSVCRIDGREKPSAQVNRVVATFNLKIGNLTS